MLEDASPTDLLRWCAERSGDLVVLADRSGRLSCASPAATRALGLAAGAPAGGSLLESAHPEDRAALARALAADGPSELAVRHRATDGERTIEWSLRPLGDAPDADRVLWSRAGEAGALEPIALDVAAILHDVKNPISGLRLALVALAGQLGEEESAILGNLVERLQKVETALRKALPKG